uniref:Uncharacterized protein n=1 Tax=Leptospira santarosai serovar Arenal str. MAVJ 401 TaxID=1049976 RepID=M6JC79_9LEPT|nr:hypothetical protein LEP1GSC063_2282 [Leptospira santarosai serovar Arenal str. MAVJ 401]
MFAQTFDQSSRSPNLIPSKSFCSFSSVLKQNFGHPVI